MTLDRRSLVLGVSRALVALAAVKTFSPNIALSQPAEKTLLPEGAERKFAQINGYKMHYVLMGSGPLVILLHGWPQTWFAWRETIQQVSAKFTVIAPDLRGCGLSEITKDGYDKATIAKDIRDLVTHVGFKAANIVGHDMGGKAAYVMAHLYPETVSKLVLVDCLLPGTENLDALRGGAWHYGFHIAKDVPEMLTKGREREYISTQIKAWSYNKTAISEEAISEYARHYARPGGMTAGFNYYRALKQDLPLAERLRGKKLPMPVMVMGGEFSAGDRLVNALKPEASNLTGYIAKGSGHFVAEEAADFFIEKLSAFLS
ncbi:MAG: alpha/beta hydrolase [Micavibrio aeruginosavorus]|uniref:Alpha/beta hydrolase n=1 Tax=Micavibrio aeruginosavorus TaxID=349221 RepID=A0A2W5HFX7_9BACT|nr:MAG: alpha/beta hydrolase [Micavibrio aeruginosavorus]